MLWLTELMFALAVALLLTLFLAPILSWRRGKRTGLPDALFLFILVFLFAWVAGVWVQPIGPVLYDVYWTPFVAAGLLYILLLLALLPPAYHHRRRDVNLETPEAAREPEAKAAVFGIFFWVLALALILAIVAGYIVEA